MGQAIGLSLPMAVGIAISPIPIIAVVLMLTSRQGRVNGPLFLAGWLAGLGLVGTAVLAVAGPADAAEPSGPATWVSGAKLVLGLSLVLVGLRQLHRRPHGDEQPSMPTWMATIDKTTPIAAFGLAAALAGANPKNLLLAAGGAVTITQTGISIAGQALAYLAFALIATLGVGVPVIISFAMGARSAALLTGLKDWMSRYNAVIMALLCLVIATKLLGEALAGFTE